MRDVQDDFQLNLRQTLADIAGTGVWETNVTIVSLKAPGILQTESEVFLPSIESAATFQSVMECCCTEMFSKIQYFDDLGTANVTSIQIFSLDDFLASPAWEAEEEEDEDELWEKPWFQGTIGGIGAAMLALFLMRRCYRQSQEDALGKDSNDVDKIRWIEAHYPHAPQVSTYDTMTFPIPEKLPPGQLAPNSTAAKAQELAALPGPAPDYVEPESGVQAWKA
ncbi:hypothetical protein CYMTET_39416 [Cymbomonas tetramitiformis]|uniref:Uncharacterized protein n=1 Tax=Cymbomonas tetramitiformis TaxID=36881 RepID=A0AAE0F4H7_9CHLO|nr:hypothetical protein CYMTET_43915 [Cymbomonas tetramitiformis]KAK3251229.1 hypothetical protein CYMTET_39416 [Cymbomonas tetramitiformis]|eukprot:gene8337-9907_t